MNKILELRKKAGLSQNELAAKLNVHQTAISQWETGKTHPDMNTIRLLADLFNTTTDYLLHRTDVVNAHPEKKEDAPAADDDIWELRERLRRQPGLRLLFSASENATQEDLLKVAKIVEDMKSESKST